MQIYVSIYLTNQVNFANIFLTTAHIWTHWHRRTAGSVEHNIFDRCRPQLVAPLVGDEINLVCARRQGQLPISPRAIVGHRVQIRLERAIRGAVDASLQVEVVGGFVVLKFEKAGLLNIDSRARHADRLLS